MISLDLVFEAIIFGVLVGCFYGALSLGLSIAFGLLDVPHIAHAAFLVLAAYAVFLLGTYGFDPLVAALWFIVSTTKPLRSAEPTRACVASLSFSASRLLFRSFSPWSLA